MQREPQPPSLYDHSEVEQIRQAINTLEPELQAKFLDSLAVVGAIAKSLTLRTVHCSESIKPFRTSTAERRGFVVDADKTQLEFLDKAAKDLCLDDAGGKDARKLIRGHLTSVDFMTHELTEGPLPANAWPSNMLPSQR